MAPLSVGGDLLDDEAAGAAAAVAGADADTRGAAGAGPGAGFAFHMLNSVVCLPAFAGVGGAMAAGM
jgi:hypothetical protein